MTRILIVHPRPTRGGFTAVVSQCRELVELGGFEVTVAVGRGDRVTELDPAVDVQVLRRPLTSIRGLVGLARVVRRVRPDVLHLHGRQAGVLGRLVVRRSAVATVLYTPHGTPWSRGSWWRAAVTDIVERLLLRRTAHVLCVSRSEQADWVRRDTSARIVHFPNLLPGAVAASSAGGASVEPARHRGVVVPSGYHPQKRVDVVVRALSLLPEPRMPVLVTGPVDDASYKGALEKLAAELGVADDITFAGNSPSVGSLMREASLVVLPSYAEGLPIVGQEAVAVGANVAWSAIPPHFELFGNTGAHFWTAEELAAVMAADHRAASVEARRPWLLAQQEDARRDRASWWGDLRVAR